jgi:hypothetical protein
VSYRIRYLEKDRKRGNELYGLFFHKGGILKQDPEHGGGHRDFDNEMTDSSGRPLEKRTVI